MSIFENSLNFVMSAFQKIIEDPPINKTCIDSRKSRNITFYDDISTFEKVQSKQEKIKTEKQEQERKENEKENERVEYPSTYLETTEREPFPTCYNFVACPVPKKKIYLDRIENSLIIDTNKANRETNANTNLIENNLNFHLLPLLENDDVIYKFELESLEEFNLACRFALLKRCKTV